MRQTITFDFNEQSYAVDVSKKRIGNYTLYLVHFRDEELKQRYEEFALVQENETGNILDDVSRDQEESDLKSVIIENIQQKSNLFNSAD